MRNRPGFTLVELLTAVGIVVIVTGILFPVFAAVRERGRRTSCQNNLKQIALGVEMYVHDNDGQYPLPFWQGSIYPYVRNKQVFACPDNPQDYAGPIPLYDTGVIDYSYDDRRLDVFRPPFPTKDVRGVAETALAFPSDTWLNMDREWSGSDGVSHFARAVAASCGRKPYACTLHSGGGNYSFADGHVCWLTPENFGEAECAAGPLPFPFKD